MKRREFFKQLAAGCAGLFVGKALGARVDMVLTTARQEPRPTAAPDEVERYWRELIQALQKSNGLRLPPEGQHTFFKVELNNRVSLKHAAVADGDWRRV